MRESIDPEDGYVSACYWIQRKLHEVVDENYPVAKFMVALEEIEKEGKEMEKSSKTGMRGKTFR